MSIITKDVDVLLQKKYHQDIVFNYAEYPTKDHWSFDFTSVEFKKGILDWFPRNKDKKIFFYVHIPFCEQLCYFCTCSKIITKDYERVSEYLEYLFKEIDLLFEFLSENNIELNVGTVFFGGGSPTILNKDDLVKLVTKLRGLFDWSNVDYFTIETDPRRVDEERLIFNHEACGANRISFGMQDFDPEVQRRVNRIQPLELFESILTDRVRECYEEIAFDLLIGQPGQTVESMKATCEGIIRLKPTLVQLSLMAYKPWVAKHQLQMLAEGPLPDFFERKQLLAVIHGELQRAGYIRTGFECYSLPGSPMTRAFEDGEAHYGASGHQPGGKVNFLGVGNSSMSNLGEDYYAQNFYDLDSYKKCLNKGSLPTFRGMKLSEDDRIRQHATQQIRSYFSLDYENFSRLYKIDFKDYFKNEIDALDEFQVDGLLVIKEEGIVLTETGRDFVQRIMNVFDVYDPPDKSINERLDVVKKAKELQRSVQERLEHEI
jgi:oxygen-independent coproporphyrinogen III oxidase